MTTKEALPYLQAYAEGKTLQLFTSEGWYDNKVDPLVWIGNDNWTPAKVRIKPEPCMVPLEMSDIDLHRDLFRYHAGGDPMTAWTAGAKAVWIGVNTSGVAYLELQKYWERSTDPIGTPLDKRTWHKCEKEVQ